MSSRMHKVSVEDLVWILRILEHKATALDARLDRVVATVR